MTEEERNRETKLENTKSTEKLTQIQEELKKYKARGDSSQYLKFLEDLWAQKTEILSPKSDIDLFLQSELAHAYFRLRKFNTSQNHFQELLNEQRRVLGEEHPETLQTESFLGLTYGYLEQYDKALAVFQELLNKQRRVLGEEHPETLQTEFLLGGTYGYLKQYDKALAVFQVLLNKQRRILGEEHLETLRTESLLGLTYRSLEQYDKALTVSQELLDKQRRVLGEEHPETLQTESFLGLTYGYLKQYDKALTAFRGLVDKQHHVLDKEDSKTLRAELILGLAYIFLQQHKKTLDTFQKLLGNQRRLLIREHPKTLKTQSLINKRSQSLEQYIKEVALLQEQLDKQRHALNEEHLEILDTNRSIESNNFKIQDYELISRFPRYDFDFNRSRRYSEQTGVPLVNPSENEISSFFTGDTKNSFENIFLKIQNFLNLEDVQLQIKPITCIYGANQVGKSNVSRLLYGVQHSSIRILEKLAKQRYSRRIVNLSASNELNPLKSELEKTRLSKDLRIRLMIPEKVHRLLIARLSDLIEEQMSEIPLYFYPSGKKWENLIGKLNSESICHIHSSRSSFHCDIEVKKDEGKPSINLKLKSSFKIELELVYESNERNLKEASIFEVLYNLSSLNIRFSGRQPIQVPLKKIKSSDNLKHLPILHHVMYFSGISYLSNQDLASLTHKEISEIVNDPEIISKEELDILDNRLVYLIYDSLLIELWKMSPFSFFTEDARYIPAERGGILERMPTYVLDLIDQDKTPKIPEGLREYGRFLQKSLLVSEEDKSETRSKLPARDQRLLREIDSDLIEIFYHLELKVSQDRDGVSNYVFVRKRQKDGKEEEGEFELGVLPSSVFSLFALNLHIRLSKLKTMLFYEEPETHLHPNSMRKLCDLFVKIYHNFQSEEEHNLAMFFTTHSGFFLDFLFIALERKYGLDRMKKILSVVRLFKDDDGGTKSEPIEVTKEGYSDSPFDEEDLMTYKALIDVYNKHTPDVDNHWDELE